jgi:hypothetical protein
MCRYFPLSSFYSSFYRLLIKIIGLTDASIDELLLEALSFEKDDHVEYLRSILNHLNDIVRDKSDYLRRLKSIKNRVVWPIFNKSTVDNVDHLASVVVDGEWFIVDIGIYIEMFYSIIPLIYFYPEALQRIYSLISVIDLHSRRLSRVA